MTGIEREGVRRMRTLLSLRAIAMSALLVGGAWLAIAAPFVGGH